MKNPQTVAVYPEKNNNPIVYVLWRLLRAALLSAGVLTAITAVWNVSLQGLVLLPSLGMAAVLLCCAAGTYLGTKKKICRVVAVVPWLVFLPICIANGNPIAGGMSWINRIITRWNSVHDGGLPLLPTSDLAGDIIAFTLVFTMLNALLAWLASRGGSHLKVSLLALFWLLVQLVGEVFHPLAAAFLLCGILGEYMSRRNAYRTLHAGAVWAVCAVLLIGFALTLPMGNIEAVDLFRKNTEAGVHTLRYGETTLPEGNLAKADMLRASDKDMLTVQSTQEKNLYLRGFVAGDYEDGVWSALPDSAYGGDQSGLLKWLKNHNFDPLMQVAQYYSLSDASDKPSENRITVSLSGAERCYVYTPTSVSGTDWHGVLEDKDTRFESVALTGVHNYTVDERSGSRPAELTVAESWLTDPQTDAQKEYCEAEAVYRDFVYDSYTQVDEKLLPVLQSVFWDGYQAENDGIYSAVRRVRDVLEKQITYTNVPEAAPEGEDPIAWFLTQSRSGNAVQYASAAVQALRAHGIPARYVEGYYASSTALAGSGEATLTGRDAHAWAEVYFDGIGWLPIDTTPGYYYDTLALQDMVGRPDQVRKTAALENSNMEVAPVTKPGGGSGLFADPVHSVLDAAKLLLGAGAGVVLVLTLLFLILELARGAVNLTEIRKYKSAKGTEKILFLGRKILCYLCLWNIEAGLGWNTAEVDKKIVETFPDIEPGSYTRVCELLEKAVYGGIALEAYEERTIRSFLERLVTPSKKTSFKTRLKLHYAGVLYPWFARAQKSRLTE